MGRSNHDTPCEKREPQKSLGQALHSVRARKAFSAPSAQRESRQSAYSPFAADGQHHTPMKDKHRCSCQVGLSMIASADTDTLLLRCEHYARCVSLYGDGFDTLFDDNFFDLLPGETKCIRVLRSPSSGVIYAETAYDQTIVSCQWKKEKEK